MNPQMIMGESQLDIYPVRSWGFQWNMVAEIMHVVFQASPEVP